MRAEPLVSVIVPCVNGLPVVVECVRSLREQAGDVPLEVLVADRTGEATRTTLRRYFPDVTILAAGSQTSIPALRALALAKARGAVVAVLEDHCLARRGWVQAIARAHRAGHRVVSGPVENGCVDRSVDWAAFLCEYAAFTAPVPRGPVAAVPGNNCAYDRQLFEHLGFELDAEEWEGAWHARLRRLGVVFHSDPDMAVLHRRPFGHGEFAGQRYHYSRSFAGRRLRGAPSWKRLGYAAATALLPGLLLFRIGRAVLRKGRHVGVFLRSLPVLMAFLAAWAVGEAVGALLGPGRSLEQVK